MELNMNARDEFLDKALGVVFGSGSEEQKAEKVKGIFQCYFHIFSDLELHNLLDFSKELPAMGDLIKSELVKRGVFELWE